MNTEKYEGCKEYLYNGCTFWYIDMNNYLTDETEVYIYGCEGDVAEYPATIEGYKVADICKRELVTNAHDCEVAILPEGLTKIWQDAFRGGERLKEVVIPSTIKFIAFQAFADCPNLTKVTLPWRKAMAIARAFQRSNNIQEICFSDSDQKYTLDEALSYMRDCINAVRAVESGKADGKAKELYDTIEKNDWMIDVKEMM